MGYFSEKALDLEREGAEAAASNVPMEECPYPMGSAERPWWVKGYEEYERDYNAWLDEVASWDYGDFA
jgi:hypothetical protein